jgi:beta-lactamase regulating signal transducer with metallopeptidase domain
MISWLIEAALRTLLVALAVAGGLRLLRVSNVLAQKKAWGLVLAAALLMPLLMRWQWLSSSAPIRVPVHSWAPTANAQPHEAEDALSTSPALAQPVDTSRTFNLAQQPMDRMVAPAASHPASLTPSVAPQSKPNPFEPLALAWLLYLGISAVLLARLLYGIGAVTRLWMTAEPVCLTPESDLTAGLRLRSSLKIASPAAVGSGVLLPADYARWDPQKLRIVLAHERSHIRHGDFYLQALADLHAVLFWFSPLAWWLKRKLSDLSEAVSDHAGLEVATSRFSYAQILLEFAAMPRPTLLGVAMARNSRLSHRIERFLNEPSFRLAFAGSRRRMALAILVAPVAFFAANALVRVEAAGQASPQPAPQVQPETSIAGQAQPDPAPLPAELPAPGSLATPAPPSAPNSSVISAVLPATPPIPPQPGLSADGRAGQDGAGKYSNSHDKKGYSYAYSTNGDSYVLVTSPNDHMTFSGDWNQGTQAEIEKARRQTNGKFLWFKRNGKPYFVDDPVIVGQIEAMYQPIEALGKQQEELGRQQEAFGKQQEELSRKMEEAGTPTPEMRKEMADLGKQIAELEGMQKNAKTAEDRADLEGKQGSLEGRMGAIEGELGAKEGAFGEEMGKLGGLQGELGAQQGKLGAEQGRLAAEADLKIKAMIDAAFRDGKARPVE